jgi:hypothetical protein
VILRVDKTYWLRNGEQASLWLHGHWQNQYGPLTENNWIADPHHFFSNVGWPAGHPNFHPFGGHPVYFDLNGRAVDPDDRQYDIVGEKND